MDHMPTVTFRHFDGRRFAIPDEVLAVCEVTGDLPERETIVALEENSPVTARSSGDEGYQWRLEPCASRGGLAYVVGPAEVEALTPGVSPCEGVVIEAGPDEMVVRIRGSSPARAMQGRQSDPRS